VSDRDGMMRRTLGFISIGIGVFLLVAAPLVKWYLAPRAARIPLDEHSVTTSVSDGQSLALDQGTLRIRTGLTLTNRLIVQGDGPAGSGRVAVWDSLTRLTDADGTMIAASKERTARDRLTGAAVNCCEEQLDGVPVKHQGLTFTFPFDTRQQTYSFWDAETQRAWPIDFKGVENAFGLSLYHFTQTVPATDVQTLEAPLSLLSRPGEGSATVHRYYENVVDLLVEPTTGIIVRGGQHTVQTLRDSTGTTLATVADVNATFTDATQRYWAQRAKDAISQFGMVRAVLPLTCLILGVVLAGLGLFLVGLPVRRRPVPSPPADAPEPVPTS
jgi:Porin PorA